MAPLKINRLALLLLFAGLFGAVGQAQTSEVSSMKTLHGYILIWNKPNNYFTIEITGKDIKPGDTAFVSFDVDGRFLQIQSLPNSNFLGQTKVDRGDGWAILAAHRDWESAYIEQNLKQKLKFESSKIKLADGKPGLMWSYEMPPGFGGSVQKQLYLTTLNGENVILLNSVISNDGSSA